MVVRQHQTGEEFKENVSPGDQILRDADGIAFLFDTYKSFFDDMNEKHSKEKAIKWKAKYLAANIPPIISGAITII